MNFKSNKVSDACKIVYSLQSFWVKFLKDILYVLSNFILSIYLSSPVPIFCLLKITEKVFKALKFRQSVQVVFLICIFFYISAIGFVGLPDYLPMS